MVLNASLLIALIGVVLGKELCSTTTKDLDVILVVDRSNSIWIRDFKLLKLFLASTVTEMQAVNPEGTRLNVGYSFTCDCRIALVTYGGDVTLHFNLDDNMTASNMNETMFAIDRRSGKYNGFKTRTYDALAMVNNEIMPLAREDASITVLLFTDGESNGMTDARDFTISTAKWLKTRRNMTLIAVGVGPKVDMEELMGVSSDQKIGSTVFYVDAFNELSESLKDMIVESTVCIKDEQVCIVHPIHTDVLVVPYGTSAMNWVKQNLTELMRVNDPLSSPLIRFGLYCGCDEAEYGFNLDTPKEEIKWKMQSANHSGFEVNQGPAALERQLFVRNFNFSALPNHVESMYNVLVASTNETRGLEHNRFIYLVLATELSERELNTLIKHNLEQTPYQLVIILIPEGALVSDDTVNALAGAEYVICQAPAYPCYAEIQLMREVCDDDE